MMEDFLNEFTKELILATTKPKQIEKPVLPYLRQPVRFNPSMFKPSIMPNPVIKPQKLRIMRPKKPLLPQNQIPAGQDKIDFLLRNPRVTAIECPGPGKFIILRKGFRTELTRISMTEDEIKRKINEFSEKAKIPLIGGLFKATVGNLTISAVVSDYAGSRFIISKFFPTNIPQRLPKPRI